jgi:acetyl-CoA acetyltransferase
VIVVSAERAKMLRHMPAYLLAWEMGASAANGSSEDNHEPYTNVGFNGLAERMWDDAGYGLQDVDVAQIYEKFFGMAVQSLIDHGFCTSETAADFVRFENLIALNGKLPVSTAGGNIAEGFIHGMNMVLEAVRQIRGSSTNQVPHVRLSLMAGGPGDSCTSTALFGSEDAL